RTLTCCNPASTKLPPALVLLLASCCSTWLMLRPQATNFVGSRRTWYSRVVPPKLTTSTTLGTDLNCFSRVQSSIDFNSIRSYFGLVLFSVYQKICPTGLQSVPICGCKPFGSVTCAS